jgi:hypothetical protein
LYVFGEPEVHFVIFSSVAPHRGQPAAKWHLRWQPTRRLAVSCGLGRRRIQTRTAGQQSGTLPLSHHATNLSHHATNNTPLYNRSTAHIAYIKSLTARQN